MIFLMLAKPAGFALLNNCMQKIKLSFSPCPNDTFMFDALIHHKIDTEGLIFEVSYDDIETLNKKAFSGESDMTKLSSSALSGLLDAYIILNSGSALGFGVGPLLVSTKPYPEISEQIKDLKIGIPGKFTTANFLLGLAYPNAVNREVMLFSAIEGALLEGKIDLGLLIHENRFTYADKGLHKIADLGEYWQERTGLPIPLAGIVVKRSFESSIIQKLDRVLNRSIQFAFDNPKSGLEFIRANAQEMNEEVMYRHIELYVNKYSLDLGKEGRQAFEFLFAEAGRQGADISQTGPLFSEHQPASEL